MPNTTPGDTIKIARQLTDRADAHLQGNIKAAENACFKAIHEYLGYFAADIALEDSNASQAISAVFNKVFTALQTDNRERYIAQLTQFIESQDSHTPEP